MSARARHLSIITVLTLVSSVVVYFLIAGFTGVEGLVAGFDGLQNFGGLFERPFGAAAEAAQIEAMFVGHFILMAFLFSIIVVPLLYTVVVFRQEEGDETDAPHIHGNTPLEIAWTLGPVVLVVIFAIWGVRLYNGLVSPTDGERVVRTQGFKWDWTFYYPDMTEAGAERVFSSPSLVLRVGEPVLLEMQSNDVIHAFWVPEFRVKQDVVPFNTTLVSISEGGSNIQELSFTNVEFDEAAEAFGYAPQEIRFTPTETGVYRLRCAEICGTNHWGMLANVFVLDANDYAAWEAGELELPADPSFTNGQPGVDGFFLDELDAFCDEHNLQNCDSDY